MKSCFAVERQGQSIRPGRVRDDDDNADEQARCAVVAFRPGHQLPADQGHAQGLERNPGKVRTGTSSPPARRVRCRGQQRQGRPSNALTRPVYDACQNCHKPSRSEPMLRPRTETAARSCAGRIAPGHQAAPARRCRPARLHHLSPRLRCKKSAILLVYSIDLTTKRRFVRLADDR